MDTYSSKEHFDYFLKCEIAYLSFLITSGTFFFFQHKKRFQEMLKGLG